jgi:hypothetical protein
MTGIVIDLVAGVLAADVLAPTRAGSDPGASTGAQRAGVSKGGADHLPALTTTSVKVVG